MKKISSSLLIFIDFPLQNLRPPSLKLVYTTWEGVWLPRKPNKVKEIEGGNSLQGG